MIELWREFIYPLGFLSSVAFGLRGLLQWVTSEVQQQSVVTKAFWRLSLVGNLLLMIHSFFQLQFHVCIVQACNSVISWRNLNLMGERSKQQSLRIVLQLFIASILFITLGFVIQGYLFGNGSIEWFRLPSLSSDEPMLIKVGVAWHALGCIALILFSSRFWIQWWHAEQNRVSSLNPLFWWISLWGGILTLVYFIRIDDPVNVVGPAFGLFPYIRNLMLIYRQRPLTSGAV